MSYAIETLNIERYRLIAELRMIEHDEIEAHTVIACAEEDEKKIANIEKAIEKLKEEVDAKT